MKVGIIGLISFSDEPATVTDNLLKVINVHIDQTTPLLVIPGMNLSVAITQK